MKKLLSIVLLALLLAAAGCATGKDESESSLSSSDAQLSQTAQPSSSAPEPEPQPAPDVIETITMAAVGDDLIHDIIWQQAAARAAEGENYSFAALYEHVRPLIESADIAVVNQETQMAASRPPSNYPLFNSPPELAGDLAEAGFDVATIANNHMLDQGVSGLRETIELLRSTPGLSMAGAYTDMADRENITTLTVRGVTFAFLSYTESTNGIPLPADSAGMIIYASDSAVIKEQVERAAELADFVIVSVHWGYEGTNTPTAFQRELAAKLSDWGADVILGHHPHAIQPLEFIGDTAVYYSLGNFVSAQIEPVNLVGAMANLTFEKNLSTGEKRVVSAGVLPLVTHYGRGFSKLAVYPLADYTAEQAASHGITSSFGYDFSLEYIDTLWQSVFGKAADDEAA